MILIFGFKTHCNLIVNLLCPKHPFQQWVEIEMSKPTTALKQSVVSREEGEHRNGLLRRREEV